MGMIARRQWEKDCSRHWDHLGGGQLSIRTFLPIIIVIILLTAVMSCRNEVVGTVCKVSHQTRRGLQMVSLLTQLQETQPQAAIHAWIHIWSYQWLLLVCMLDFELDLRAADVWRGYISKWGRRRCAKSGSRPEECRQQFPAFRPVKSSQVEADHNPSPSRSTNSIQPEFMDRSSDGSCVNLNNSDLSYIWGENEGQGPR